MKTDAISEGKCRSERAAKIEREDEKQIQWERKEFSVEENASRRGVSETGAREVSVSWGNGLGRCGKRQESRRRGKGRMRLLGFWGKGSKAFIRVECGRRGRERWNFSR